MEFKLTETQLIKLNEWKAKIKDLYGEYGLYEFRFTPTGIGTGLVVVSLLTTLEIDLTEYKNW